MVMVRVAIVRVGKSKCGHGTCSHGKCGHSKCGHDKCGHGRCDHGWLRRLQRSPEVVRGARVVTRKQVEQRLVQHIGVVVDVDEPLRLHVVPVRADRKLEDGLGEARAGAR